MIGYVLGGISVAGVAMAILWLAARRAGAIWRGDASKVPVLHLRMVEVGPRTYPSFLLCIGAFTVGVAVGGVGVALVGASGLAAGHWPTYVILAGVIVVFSNVVWVPLNWFVHATGRPKFLVPPPYRDQPGSIAAARMRRKRKRAGQPETDHLVEIFDVRPEPGDDHEPYFVAICAYPECGWMEFADGDVVGRSGEEQARANAARHSTNVAREAQRRP